MTGLAEEFAGRNDACAGTESNRFSGYFDRESEIPLEISRMSLKSSRLLVVRDDRTVGFELSRSICSLVDAGKNRAKSSKASQRYNLSYG